MSIPGRPPLLGLVLAGGRSRRMGRDKGTLIVDAQSQVERCLELLSPRCESVRISVRRAQSGLAPYMDLPLVIDNESLAGPAAGLLAAWDAFPDRALLVLAVDMPLVDGALVDFLITHRDPARPATAYRHPNGLIEPLCAIFEPGTAVPLRRVAASAGSPSLRRYLESVEPALLEPPEAARLVSVNTPEALARAREALERL